MKKRAPPAVTLDTMVDGQIGELAASESEAGLPTGDTSAGDLTPMEAAVLDMSRDIKVLLRTAQQLKHQGEALESFARLLGADMDRVIAAMRGKS